MKKAFKGFLKELSFFCTLPALVWQIIFMVAPVAIIVYFSLIGPGFILTLDHYRALWKGTYLFIIFRSMILAVLTACVTLVLGYPVAYFIGIRAKKYKTILLFFLTLPFWVNFLVQVYAWYYLLEYHGLVNLLLLKLGIISEPLMLANSLFAVGLVMIYCYLPFMVMPLYSMIEKIDSRLLEASSDLGATSWQTFKNVTLPLSLPGIKTGVLLVLIPSFGEFVIPALLGGGKNMLVGTLISYFFLVSRNNAYGAAFTCLSALALISGLFFFYVMSRVWIFSRSVRSK
jgi:spermidine/putrescine transport system permease protein